MKIKSLMFVLMGTMLVATSCSDTELENGKEGSGTVDPVKTSGLVSVYLDKNDLEASPLAGDVLIEGSRTLTLNVPAACEKVYMKYNTVSGTEAIKEFALSPVSRSGDAQNFNYATNRLASVTLKLPEDAVKPTDETDAGYLFYHNTGVVMFEDGWPTQPGSWYDEDFNDVVFEYDLKVTECQSEEQMAIQGSKEELLLTLDVRAVGGTFPTRLGVILEGLDSKYVETISANIFLKGGQGTMENLGKKLLSTDPKVTVNVPSWNWNNDTEGSKRFAILTVDKAPAEGTVITLDGLSSLKDNNQDFFQVTPGKVRVGLPMLRAEIRLIGKEGGDRTAQLEAFRELILNTQRQNFFITTHAGKEIHMKGYKPTSAYQDEYDAAVNADDKLVGDYTNEQGYTWGVKLPVGTKHVSEGESIRKAYTEFMNWVDTKGVEDKGWYLNPNAEKTVRYW
ncbi:LruC domain-containing protein [Bacteroides sp.]|uniref:LruC domain-containing protein n=1 Tax=Bacteroides sp. TaxID=29523 RepID=UPI0025C512AE|nr:LruC domain-containing protein [Bacteroides sp.]